MTKCTKTNHNRCNSGSRKAFGSDSFLSTIPNTYDNVHFSTHHHTCDSFPYRLDIQHTPGEIDRTFVNLQKTEKKRKEIDRFWPFILSLRTVCCTYISGSVWISVLINFSYRISCVVSVDQCWSMWERKGKEYGKEMDTPV